MAELISLSDIPGLVGTTEWISKWMEVSQERINQFADATDDHQFIHIDPEAAADTPFGGTIAHGFLTLSLLSAMHADCVPVARERTMGINYGFNKVRFVNPVRAGKRVRGRFTLKEARQRGPTMMSLTFDVSIEIEDEKKPALTANWLTLMQFAPSEEGATA